MRTTRIVADLHVPDLEEAAGFWGGYLGLVPEDLGLGWVQRYVEPTTGAVVQLVTADATAPVVPDVTVMTDDVDAAHAAALARGYEVVHPLTTEAWGVRRFFVRAPDGTVVNVVRHRA